MECVKKTERNMRSQSVTAVIQGPESNFCYRSTKQEKPIRVREYIVELEESASRRTKPKYNPRIKKPRDIKSYLKKQTNKQKIKNKKEVIHLQ